LSVGEEAKEEEKKRPGVVGWEKNDKGKLGPRLADLAPLMDPTQFRRRLPLSTHTERYTDAAGVVWQIKRLI
jgi:hypothetical protein